METRSAKKRRLSICKDNEEEDENGGRVKEDRISDLPDAVLHHILFLVPIKTIAQTSVLSKRWRSIWSTFPDLDFSSIISNQSCNGRLQSFAAKTIDSITHVLSLRNRHSDIRTLRFRGRLSFSRLNCLIRSAIRNNVQQLDVEVSTNDYFNFPRCVLASKSLRSFRLKSRFPGFRLPPSSLMTDGFKTLQSLSLSLIILHSQPSLLEMFSDSSFPLLKKLSLDACFGLIHLNVNCRALEDFTLENCFQLQRLNISSPKLERLRIASCFNACSEKSWVNVSGPRLKSLVWNHNTITDSISLQQLSSLHEASIGFLVMEEDMNVAKLLTVSNLLSALSHVHCLTLESQSVEILSNNNYFAVYLFPFNNLRSLTLHTGFHKNNVPGLANVFRSSPNLNTLILKIINSFKTQRRQWNRDLWETSSGEEEQFWESQTENLKSFLDNLKMVKIYGFMECENEVSLAKFFLKHGKALQEMSLRSGPCHAARDSLRRQKIRSQLMGFSWASSNAKIVFN